MCGRGPGNPGFYFIHTLTLFLELAAPAELWALKVPLVSIATTMQSKNRRREEMEED